MFAFPVLFFIYLIIPKIVNGIHVEISGTVYCKFHLGDTSVKARLQGAKVELYERENVLDEDVFGEGLTNENGIFTLEGKPTDSNPFGSVRPHLRIYHQCYTPSSKDKIKEGYHYLTDISLLPDKEGKYDMEISVGVAVAADITLEGKKVQIENDEDHLKTKVVPIKS
uniref:Uncharacterized protein n=1 Tax=Meloidogyne incognita TaxID=6306 RepID=A0A914MQZ2_MELIC